MNTISENKEYFDKESLLIKYLIISKKYEEAHALILKLLKVPYNDDKYIYELLSMQQECEIDYNKYILYNKISCNDISDCIKSKSNDDISSESITVTMTTCKRLDLFTQTVNSFIACCTDLKEYIREWIVVDDNSSEEDKKTMKDLYPFITFIFKNENQKGHALSMNMLIDLIDTPYVLHLEDDWKFFYPGDFITKCVKILSSDTKYGQCLFNRAYGEDINTGYKIGGGHRRYLQLKSGTVRYYIHEYAVGDSLNQIHGKLANMGLSHSSYWPHYSLRVGLTKKTVFSKIGKYNENADHFERDYAYRYREFFLTTYLDNINCIHIGRKTYERDSDKLNAYDLNKERQFGGQPKNSLTHNSEIKLDHISAKTNIINTPLPPILSIKTYVLNLARRPDRLNRFKKMNRTELHNFHTFEAIDGLKLSACHKIQKLFEHNDYNYRRGIVGCAISHLLMWIELIKSKKLQGMLIIEDDAELAPNFIHKLLNTIYISPDADIIFLGHHPRTKDSKNYDKNKIPTSELWSKDKSIKESMGGTTAYYISKKGANNMVKYINKYGFRYGVDWEMFFNDINKVYYCSPYIAFADCAQNNEVDTDIQNVYDGISYTEDEWLLNELKYWNLKTSNNEYGLVNKFISMNKDELDMITEDANSKLICRSSKCSKKELLTTISIFDLNTPHLIKWLNVFPVHWYSVAYKYMFVIPDNMLSVEDVKDLTFCGHININEVINSIK
jgi:GR25 family glycosyltransferase involved in LPS biosynthesis